MRPSGCEPTYEGLKVVLGHGLSGEVLRCEPTYEGLKAGASARR